MAQRLSCTGPVKIIDDKAVQTDIENFKSALKKTPATDAFMNAVSPGTIAHFRPTVTTRPWKNISKLSRMRCARNMEPSSMRDLCCRSTPRPRDDVPLHFQDLGKEAF